MTQWSLKDAKEHFAEVVSAAQTAPQIVTDGSQTAAVVVGREDYARLMGATSAKTEKKVTWQGREMGLVDLLLAMPHKDDFEIERAPLELRDLDL